jgi:hypothetical protein
MGGNTPRAHRQSAEIHGPLLKESEQEDTGAVDGSSLLGSAAGMTELAHFNWFNLRLR